MAPRLVDPASGRRQLEYTEISVHQFIEFALLGLGAGAVYSTAAIGLVQVYRGSGVLNLAHGAIAFVSAVIYLMARTRWGWACLPAALGGILAAGVVGAGIEVLVMRRLRSASVLVRVVATLGVFAIVQS